MQRPLKRDSLPNGQKVDLPRSGCTCEPSLTLLLNLRPICDFHLLYHLKTCLLTSEGLCLGRRHSLGSVLPWYTDVTDLSCLQPSLPHTLLSRKEEDK